jgi:hypothetical protein
MTFPRPAAFPGGRVLAGWWKQLAVWRPHSLWVGSVCLERLEASCKIRQNEPLAPLDGILLNSLELAAPRELASLDKQLGLGQDLLERLLLRLEQRGVVRYDGSSWTLTETGNESRHNDLLPGSRTERRSFWFLSDSDNPEARSFVTILNTTGFQALDKSPLSRRSFEALVLSVSQDSEWKRRRGFPGDVESILAPESTTASAASNLEWEKIVVVYPHSLQVAIITYQRQSGEMGLAIFPYQEHGWSLAARPVIELNAAWDEVFPALPLEPTADLIDEAWRKWLGQRGMSAAAGQYRLEFRGETIGVQPSSDGPDVLGTPRGDLARGEAWLVLRDGALRQVIRLEPEAVARPTGEATAPSNSA